MLDNVKNTFPSIRMHLIALFSATPAIAENSTEALAKKGQYGGAAGTVGGALLAGLESNAVVIGIAFAFISMLCTIAGSFWLIKHKRYQIKLAKLKIEEAEKRKEE